MAGHLRPGDPAGRSIAAQQLDDSDLVVVQHEFGIYGGPDGEEVIDLLTQITATRVVVLHTVLAEPTEHQRTVLQEIIELADAVVVMTRAARAIIAAQYSLSEDRLWLIPHGVDPRPVIAAHPSPRPVILTWGLIGPGKGIEWAIRALAEIAPDDRPLYRVLGQTHPKVLMDQGERYRTQLESLAANLGISDDVEIDGRYQDAPALAAQVAAATVVLLPYDSREQATSGVLAEAVAAGKIVIATRFPHAIELLSDSGILVSHEQPAEITQAIEQALHDPNQAVLARALAQKFAGDNSWANVAGRFEALLSDAADEAVCR